MGWGAIVTYEIEDTSGSGWGVGVDYMLQYISGSSQRFASGTSIDTAEADVDCAVRERYLLLLESRGSYTSLSLCVGAYRCFLKRIAFCLVGFALNLL